METEVKMMMKHVADKKRLGRVVGEGGIYDESANRRAYSQSRVCSLSPCGANRVTTERPLMCLLPAAVNRAEAAARERSSANFTPRPGKVISRCTGRPILRG